MRDAALQSLAVGFFDGVHLGHQAILRGASAALTFRNHPLSVLCPEKAPRLIMTCEERVAAIGLPTRVLDFTPDLAMMTPREFLAFANIQSDTEIVCGANWRFGKDGAGDAAWLERNGYAVTVVPYAEYKGDPVSSSRIRACLESGEIEDANAMMGRRYQVSGIRFQGKGLGEKIGYPTVNLQLETCNLKLPHGVYEVEVGGVKAIANYGLAPTLSDCAWPAPVLEVHFIHCSPPSSLASSVKVEVLRFIRPERKFDSVDDLKRQIAADCAIIGA